MLHKRSHRISAQEGDRQDISREGKREVKISTERESGRYRNRGHKILKREGIDRNDESKREIS